MSEFANAYASFHLHPPNHHHDGSSPLTSHTTTPPQGRSLSLPHRGSVVPLSSHGKCRVWTLGLQVMDGAYAMNFYIIIFFDGLLING